MMGPLRFSLVGDEIVEKGGQVLARLNPDCQPSMQDEFALWLNDIAEFGATDEVVEILFLDEEKVAKEALTTYQELRDRLGGYAIGGLVPIPIALLILREGINTVGDAEDTPVIEEPATEEEWTSDDGDETQRSQTDQVLYASQQLGDVPGDGGNVQGFTSG